MSYIRKTKDEYILQGNYGPKYGYEDLTAHDTRKEAKKEMKVYQENEGGDYRIIKKRIKKEVLNEI